MVKLTPGPKLDELPSAVKQHLTHSNGDVLVAVRKEKVKLIEDVVSSDPHPPKSSITLLLDKDDARYNSLRSDAYWI